MSMVDLLRYCAGITLWACFLQTSCLASQLSEVKTKASFLPSKLNLLTTQPDSEITTNSPRYLITQERQGEQRKFQIPTNQEFQPSIPIEEIEVIEVIADRQEYDEQRKVITAQGNVVMRFAQSVMTSDRLEINLSDRLAVAKGNVVLKRGQQVLRGAKFEYYLVSDRGMIFNARGEIYQPSLSQDTNVNQRLAPEQTIFDRALSDRLINAQPLTDITAGEGIGATIGSSRDINNSNNSVGGTINRLRFQANRLDFSGTNWTASNLRLTNDPFSPPELELRAKTATFEQVSPLVNKLTTTKSRVVIDDSLALPLLASSYAFDGRPGRGAGLFSLGFDGQDRGGLYIEKTLRLLNGTKYSLNITPQYFLERALFPTAFSFSNSEDGGFDLATLGLRSNFQANLTPRSNFGANVSLTSFNFNNIEDNLRARVGLQQTLGNVANPYTFALAYNYRDRLFNGSLGFQTVRSSIGGVLTSPNIAIANTGVNLRYQASIQNISADTDRQDLLEADRNNDRINLTRYQGALFINKNFPIWSGTALPSTQYQGLRYTPVPVVPYLQIYTGVSGVGSFYSNSDTQLSLEGTIGIQGQIGHFSRSWLDYTGFKLGYSQNLRGDESPFLFDRLVDRQILDLGITQQVYGPIRLGVQTSIDLNNNQEISTDYLVEYSRRTHNITLRYNPVLQIGSFSLRISDFNWQGNPQPFDNEGISPVIQGVKQ